MNEVTVPEVTSLAGVAALAAELRALRVSRGLAQGTIGSTAGLSGATVSRLERNEYYSTALVRHLTAYADALGYTLRFVLVHDDQPPEAGEHA
jgi:transcriptional regulator with XRE-family HTH domain